MSNNEEIRVEGKGQQAGFQTPIAFIIFKRPETTRRVFNEIKKIRPTQLFVIADGGRNKEEWGACNAARAIIDEIDWPCHVYKNYASVNLGCKQRVASGITWVFEHTERAIILEDDCLPDQTFFPYCETLLERYKDDNRIMQISGSNFQTGNPRFQCNESYYYSAIGEIWGWATWRRAWQMYDVNMSLWPQVQKEKILKNIFGDPAVVSYWEYLLPQIYAMKNRTGGIDTWDAQWVFCCWIQHGLTIMPKTNLISNIGFGKSATRSTQTEDPRANLTRNPLTFPLTHPTMMYVNQDADTYTFKFLYGINQKLSQKIRWFCKSKFPRLYGGVKKIHNLLWGY